MDAMTIFARAYGNSRNMITDKRVKLYGYRDSWAIELSKGMLNGRMVYGVTVVKMFPDMNIRRMNHYSEMYDSECNAKDYIHNKLKSRMRMFDLRSHMTIIHKHKIRPSITQR